jgi:hypothetical protein
MAQHLEFTKLAAAAFRTLPDQAAEKVERLLNSICTANEETEGVVMVQEISFWRAHLEECLVTFAVVGGVFVVLQVGQCVPTGEAVLRQEARRGT